MLLWLSYLDLRDGLLYDVITMPFAVAGLVLSMMGALIPVVNAVIGGTLCGVLFYCLYIAARGRMWLGWEAAVVAVWIAFLLGGSAAVVLLITRRKGRRDGIPFGPFLAIGGYVGYVAGAELWRLYWGIV